MELWLNSFSGFEIVLAVIVGYPVMLGALMILSWLASFGLTDANRANFGMKPRKKK